MTATGPGPLALCDPLRDGGCFDPARGLRLVRLLPNEYFVGDESLLLSTVLGSCVAACICDPVAGVGGMNHFMLPDTGPAQGVSRSQELRYGLHAMNRMLDALLAQGAVRARLEAKLFGGADVVASMKNARIGQANSLFAIGYLRDQGIRLVAQDLGGRRARMIQYHPGSGQARARRIDSRIGDAVAGDINALGVAHADVSRSDSLLPRATEPVS